MTAVTRRGSIAAASEGERGEGGLKPPSPGGGRGIYWPYASFWVASRSARIASSWSGCWTYLTMSVQNWLFMAVGIRSDASKTKTLALARRSAERLLIASG